MKVLFMIPTLSVGGAEKVLVNLVNLLNKQQFNITVMALFDGGINRKFLSSDVKYVSCFKHQIRGNSHVLKLFPPKKLYTLLVKEQYDIIVSYLEGPTARIVSGCPDVKSKRVSWIHCTMHNKEEFAVGFRNYNEAKLCYEKYDRCIFVSKEVQDNFLKYCERRKGNEVLYNTNNSKKIIEMSYQTPDEKFFCDDKTFKICAVGKIIPVKGFDRLARIHKKLLNDGYNIQVFILGIGTQQEEIEKYIQKNGLQGSFHFMGYKTNPYKYIRRCDLFVCSSLSEGFSTAVTESLIIGTPVVTTNVSGMKELLGDSEYGLITDNNETALRKGIQYLLDNPAVLQEYKEKAIIRGEEFKSERTVNNVEKMFLHLMEER